MEYRCPAAGARAELSSETYGIRGLRPPSLPGGLGGGGGGGGGVQNLRARTASFVFFTFFLDPPPDPKALALMLNLHPLKVCFNHYIL